MPATRRFPAGIELCRFTLPVPALGVDRLPTCEETAATVIACDVPLITEGLRDNDASDGFLEVPRSPIGDCKANVPLYAEHVVDIAEADEAVSKMTDGLRDNDASDGHLVEASEGALDT